MDRFKMWIFQDDLIFNLMQLAVFGCFTGIGSTFGAEIVKSLTSHIRKKIAKEP